MYLILENGEVLEGKSFGIEAETIGELVFSTGMNGYVETLTDLSYYGQMVVQTYPIIGNYGVIPDDFESNTTALKAYIVKHWTEYPSNFRSKTDINSFLKEKNIIGLYDIDTRYLTKAIREFGAMNAMISYDIKDIDEKIQDIKSFKIQNAVKSVSSKKITSYNMDNGGHKILLWDFGSKENIKRELIKRNCKVIVVPYNITAKEIKELRPDGIVLSNGPGNPKDNKEIITQIKEILKYNIPVFGICLGHQLLALACGGDTKKLKYGHRSITHPVKDVKTGKVYITSQNHGYSVDENKLPYNSEINFYSVNDNTCEGIKYKNIPAFSVQFHPESAAGPQETEFLFDEFLELIH